MKELPSNLGDLALFVMMVASLRGMDDNTEDPDDDDYDDVQNDEWENWSQWSRGNWWTWDNWGQYSWHQQATSAPTSLGAKVSTAASSEADKFLPDFVVAWMLLQRSGLDVSERGANIANLMRNWFTTDNVKQSLKLNWPEDDLRLRDSQRVPLSS